MAGARLVYSISSERLTGFVGNQRVNMWGGSGGRAGSTRVSPISGLANNPAASLIQSTGAVGSKGHMEGGPIPQGRYAIRLYGGTHGWPQLSPVGHSAYGRTSFAIHAQGHHGSDGCIVVSSGDYQRLLLMLRGVPMCGDVGELEVIE